LKRTGLRIARQLLVVGVLLTYPIWDLPLKRRIDPQMERIELAVKAERAARSKSYWRSFVSADRLCMAT
jgi:hypothetical protein